MRETHQWSLNLVPLSVYIDTDKVIYCSGEGAGRRERK